MNALANGYACLTKIITDAVIGKHISDIRLLTPHDLLFIFAESKETGLAISLVPQKPLATLIALPDDIMQWPKLTNAGLRSHIIKAKIDAVTADPNDYIIRLSGHRMADNYQIEPLELIVELIKTHPNIVFIRHGRIAWIHKQYGLDRARPLLPGLAYFPPEGNAPAATRDWLEEANHYQATIIAESYRIMAAPLVKKLKQRRRQLSGKLEALMNDRNRWTAALNAKDEADALLTYGDLTGRFPYLDIGGRRIELDQSRSVSANAALIYKRYRKAKAAAAPIQQQIEVSQTEAATIDAAIGQPGPRTMFDIEALEMTMSAIGLPINKPIPTKKEAPQAMLPYLIVHEGVTYSFGRSAIQNDNLTFRRAAPTDWFFHIKDIPGAHIIVHQTELDKPTIETAAMLALCLSHVESGTVAYAQVKTLRRGHQQGQVLMRFEETVYMNHVDSLIIKMAKEAKRHQR